MRKLLVFLATLVCGLVCELGHGEMVVTYTPAPISTDFPNVELLRLALEKTRPTYGDYVLKPTIGLTLAERVPYLQRNILPNFVAVLGFDAQRDAMMNLDYIPVPVDQGVLGWRICFVNKLVKAQVAESKTLKDLARYSIVQGTGWIDNKILRDNGLNVFEVEFRTDGANLFQMTASGHADLYCRGIVELPLEWEKNKGMKNLGYDESFVLVYKMPMFFYVNKINGVVKKRIEEGLVAAYQDGSLQSIWNKHFQSYLDFAKLKQRKSFFLENAAAGNLSSDYERYLLTPTAKNP